MGKWEAKRREEEERKRMEEDHFDQLQNDPKGKKKKGKGENEPSGRKSGEKTGQQWSSIRSTINVTKHLTSGAEETPSGNTGSGSGPERRDNGKKDRKRSQSRMSCPTPTVSEYERRLQERFKASTDVTSQIEWIVKHWNRKEQSLIRPLPVENTEEAEKPQ